MSNTIEGTVNNVGEQEHFPSGFYKRSVLLTTKGEYPQTLQFDFMKERVEQLENVRNGDDVTIHFDIRGREHNGRYYTDLVGWKLETA